MENGTSSEDDSAPNLREKFFLISKYDFKKIKLEGGNKITMSFSDNQRLKKSILECLPEFQKTALLFSMGNPDSLDLIQNKVEELKKRLVNVALSMTLKSSSRFGGISAGGGFFVPKKMSTTKNNNTTGQKI